MKQFILVSLAALIPFAVTPSLATEALTKIQGEDTMKEKVKQLLKSIETGNQKPVSYINPQKYIQHNLNVKDGLAGFGEVLSQLPKGSAKVNTVRTFRDGNYVFTHTEYNFFGPKIGFDIFRFEDGLIVEHWDNLQQTENKTASGRTQIDGPTIPTDLDKTLENKALVKNFIDDILLNGKVDKITTYISKKKYHQHNPNVSDGLDALGKALAKMAKAGTPMTYQKSHIILGEGNFVLSVAEGKFLGKHVSFYDLFRIENGKIVEHWDTIEEITSKDKQQNQNGKFGFQK
ncbi:MAG: polyketide cyclase [Methyloligella sp.]|nr:MAG: polyketide cyclase [Methyloligella sp.]